jgi:arsenate reductase
MNCCIEVLRKEGRVPTKPAPEVRSVGRYGTDDDLLAVDDLRHEAFARHLALVVPQSLNHDTSFARSKSWEEFDAPGAPVMNFVFTVCDNAANESCPVWPGQPMTAHWGVPDPAVTEGTDAEKHLAFAEAYRMLNSRISIFTSLPMKTIDKLALQRQLNEIGRTMPKAG